MSSRKLSDLTQETMEMAEKHIQLCKEKNVELLIYCTLRTNAEQTELYKIGRELKGKIVTNARAGQSAHNPDKNGKSSAYDCVPLLHGKAIWDSKNPVWHIVIAAGEEAGLIASARWTGAMKESAHFQNHHWSKP